MKVVFLDFDGVLNSQAYIANVCRKPRGSEGFPDDGEMLCKSMVRRAQRICDATGAVIVLSTSWRIADKFEQLVDWLRERDLSAPVIGKTPQSGAGYRGSDIDEWLRSTTEPVESFVILDDGSDMDPHSDRLVQTDFEVGIEDRHVERAIAVLASQPATPVDGEGNNAN